MVLNKDDILNEITTNSLIEDFDSNKETKQIDNASYRCRIGKIILPYGPKEKFQLKTDQPVKLAPSEIVIIETKERVNIPKDLCCSYSILQSQAMNGLLLLNASFIEPGYKGKLSGYFINISKRDIVLSIDDEIAKIVFFRTSSSQALKELVIDDKKYTDGLLKRSANFGKSFLNIKDIGNIAAKKAAKKVNTSLTIGGLVVAILLTYSALESFIFKKVPRKDNLVEQLINDQKELEDENLKLRKNVYKNKVLLDSLMNENMKPLQK